MNITEPPATLTNQNSGDINGTTTTYTITGLTNGNSYSVWVAAKKADNTTYSGYSGMKTATPNQSTAAPGKPVVTVTPTDDGQLRIDWGAVQYASSYTVHVGATNDIASATSVAQNLTALTYTASRPQGVTSLTFYVWVSAINTTQGANNATTHSEPEAGTILDAPIDSTAVIGTWRSSGGATYTFSGTNNVVFKEDGSTTKGEGTFGYNKPSLTLNITASGGYQAPNAWNNGQVTVNGKTFTISNITYTKQ